jgi:hypothetical protein
MVRVWFSKPDRYLSLKVDNGEPKTLDPKSLTVSSLLVVWSRSYRVDWMPCTDKGTREIWEAIWILRNMILGQVDKIRVKERRQREGKYFTTLMIIQFLSLQF